MRCAYPRQEKKAEIHAQQPQADGNHGDQSQQQALNQIGQLSTEPAELTISSVTPCFFQHLRVLFGMKRMRARCRAG